MAFIPFLRADVARRLPQVVNFREEQALELDNFPEFVTDLQPSHKQAIDDLALQIVRSNQTANPIFEFRVEGFADIARTIPLAQRKQFEDEVSSERAENGFVLLLAALKRQGGEDFAKKIAKGSKAFGLGSQRLKVPNATTEAQFRKNRRVVFIVRKVTVIPPPPEPAPPPSSVVEDRFTVRLIRGGSVNVGALHVLESLTVSVTLEITDSVEKKRANFNVLATGGGFGAGPGKIGGSITLTPGRAVPFKVFRLLGPGAPAINLKSFEGKVTVFVDGGGGVGPKSQGGTLSFSFDALESAGANTQPTIVTVPGGGASLTTPTIGAGDVLPLGGMTMIGEPVSL
jgi:outer membrane protein OmpA-like peptidoglycan-associated protein